jgi:hypothetical protein
MFVTETPTIQPFLCSMRTLLILIALIVFQKPAALAQADELGNWNSMNVQLDFKGKLGVLTDVQLRTYSLGKDFGQFIIRPSLLLELNESLQLSFGTAGIYSEVYQGDEKKIKRELRLHQQALLRQEVGPVRLLHRYRVEQRFIEDSELRIRMRYLLHSMTPLTRKKFDSNTLYFVASDEVLLNTTGNVFDQNRLYTGLGWMFNKYSRIDVGPLWQSFGNSDNVQLNVVYFRVISFRNN